MNDSNWFYSLLAIVLYLLPYVIASMRRKRNANAILVLNLLLGWTAIGWVVCLVWAIKHDLVDDEKFG